MRRSRTLRAIRFDRRYFLLTALLLLAGVLLATGLARVPLLRGSLSDVLATVFVYFAVLSFFRLHHGWLAVGVFLFADLIEFGQYLHFADWLGLPRGSLASIALGNTFSWADIACYGLGCCVALAISRWCIKEAPAAPH